MALFQKKQPEVGSSIPIYSLGLNRTVLIVGLGNVGKEFDGTRHNIGFAAVDELAARQDMGSWTVKMDLKCQLVMSTIGSTRVILCKPTTMMNLSGEAVQAVSNFYKINPADIVVVHDELDIAFGQIRTRMGGSDAGNNGIKSVTQHLGEDYGRVRIGIGPKRPAQIDSADYVIGKFRPTQQKQLKNLLQETTAILTEYIHSGQLTAETRSFLV
jgi:PTH1 family peptidyl-tRNA hydrolase